ncbi:hypothetical protein LZF95_10990 [Algoriphagus sp. AGSA1]|uniref:hypothetical protein n=1 Tax=Algoriphagus sp. AGSA1 TaxID=2907213 RepID=UPI001F3E6CFD|nr:hypothetical protein [Algoriphagus sp. AGSA1]MCE7055202.1 hypothetical protein [Algoriphagus sp. AGSA1]
MGGFSKMTESRQMIRAEIAAGKSLGHVDRKQRQGRRWKSLDVGVVMRHRDLSP